MLLYTLTNRETGLIYVGATTLKLRRRMDGHLRDAIRRGAPINIAIRRYGWDAFDLNVLATTDDHEELMRLERETIARLGTMVPNGYNVTSGGLGWQDAKHSEATKSRISANRVGRETWNKGLKTGPLSAEHRANLSNAQKGRLAWNKGIPFTAEHRAKLVGKRKGAANGKARAIEFNGVRYGSIADAERALGLSKMQIKYKLRLGRATYL